VTAYGIVLDVSEWDAVDQVFAKTKADRGGLDIVVANAGISGGPGTLDQDGTLANLNQEVWQRVIDVNLTGAAATLRAAVRHLTPGDHARIVVTSSLAAVRWLPVVGYAYAASKAGVSNLVRYAAKDLGKSGIRINAIAPSGFRTNIGGGRLKNQEIRDFFATDSAFNRLAEPDEIEGLTLLLCSDASSYITGATFSIDGGAM
jgi:NAD(P)-dependent dehydrogenase (short-subunit alcohol dehydrogenase family)